MASLHQFTRRVIEERIARNAQVWSAQYSLDHLLK